MRLDWQDWPVNRTKNRFSWFAGRHRRSRLCSVSWSNRCMVRHCLVKMQPTRVSFVEAKEKLIYLLRIFGLIIVQSLTFIAEAIDRFCNHRPPSIPEMAVPNDVAAAAAICLPANADEPMEVDVGYMELIRSVIQHSRTKRPASSRRQSTWRKPYGRRHAPPGTHVPW